MFGERFCWILQQPDDRVFKKLSVNPMCLAEDLWTEGVPGSTRFGSSRILLGVVFQFLQQDKNRAPSKAQ